MKTLALLAVIASAVFVVPSSAQDKPLKDQIVGTCRLVSIETFSKEGEKIPFMEGSSPSGIFMFDGSNFSFQVIGEIPKLASNNRLRTTPEEEKGSGPRGAIIFRNLHGE